MDENYEDVKKYYLNGIEQNDPDAMNSLGVYYENIENNYTEMEKYYLKAINLNVLRVVNVRGIPRNNTYLLQLRKHFVDIAVIKGY